MNSDFSTKDLLDVAEKLIDANGQTTTLEIKMELRKNFTAYQNDVSKVMDENHEDRDLTFTANGTYRTYTRKTISTSDDNDSTSTTQASGGLGLFASKSNVKKLSFDNSKIYSYTRRDGVVLDSILQPNTGDWKVFDSGKQTHLYFAASLKRDFVRQAFANITSVKYKNTRAKRVK